MCYEEIACPRCSSLKVKKNGISAQHKPRYRCKDCERQFITGYTSQADKAGVRSLVLPMTMNGSGIADTELEHLICSLFCLEPAPTGGLTSNSLTRIPA
jgi:transposase-like protein